MSVELKLGSHHADIRKIGEYDIVGILGQGGLGYVLEAVHPSGKHCAMKTAFAIGDSPEWDEICTDAVLREQEAMEDIGSHPNIVPFIEGGFVKSHFNDSGNPFDLPCQFAVYEKLEPIELPSMMDARKAAYVGAQIASACMAIHAKGWVHRDIKFENIIIGKNYHAWLIDFGLAYKQGVHREIDKTMVYGVDNVIMGTPANMSPEQAEWVWVPPESDAYSFGAALYDMVAGKSPHEGATPLEALKHMMYAQIVPPRRHNKKVPINLNAVIMGLLNKDSERRKTMKQAKFALEKIANERYFSDAVKWVFRKIGERCFSKKPALPRDTEILPPTEIVRPPKFLK